MLCFFFIRIAGTLCTKLSSGRSISVTTDAVALSVTKTQAEEEAETSRFEIGLRGSDKPTPGFIKTPSYVSGKGVFRSFSGGLRGFSEVSVVYWEQFRGSSYVSREVVFRGLLGII